MILIRVDRGRKMEVNVGVDTHQSVWLLTPLGVNVQGPVNAAMDGEFFTIADARHGDLDRVVKALAEANPGRKVQVFNMERAATCPAAPMVIKQVTKNGVLPLTEEETATGEPRVNVNWPIPGVRR